MKIKQKFNYYEIIGKLEFPAVELKHADDFARLAETLKVSQVFKAGSEQDKNDSWFLILADSTFFKLKSQGYEDLNDLTDAIEQGYPTASEFYEGRKGSFLNYLEFIECRKAGITDRGILVNAQRGGFIENFDGFKEELTQNRLIPEGTDKNRFNSAIDLYKYAYEKGFKEYRDFSQAFFAGFPDKALYDLGTQAGFLHAEDYINATKAGFVTAETYNKAMTLKIRTGGEYLQYLDFEKKAAGKLGFDELELLKELRTFENGKKLSLKKLSELLNEILEKRKVTNENGLKELPAWFKCSIKNADHIADFLCTNDEARKNGQYDKEGEFFEITRVSDKKIYLDGSNVAYASAERSSGIKPKYNNILLMANKLKSLHFAEIFVIADSSLRHAVTDSHLFDRVKNSIKYLEAPSHTSADEFLLQKVKYENCYLVSNDTFKDWMFKDPWIANNIDRVRIPFMIINNEVSVPMLENHYGKNK
jgi:hypothetical protein